MKEIEMKRVEVSKITVAENFRKLMDKNGLKELVENVKQMGVVEPIILRKEKNELILVAGARRLEAAKENKLKDIPARVIEATEEEAEMVQAVENLHREDLNPMDEAEQFAKLLKQKGEKELAAAVNKTVKYIHRSLALLDLKPEAQKLVRARLILPAHGHLLLKVDEKHYDDTFKYLKDNAEYYKGQYPVTSFQAHVDGIVGTELSFAKFDTAACKTCAHYGKNMGSLFDNANEGLCNNKTCFANKTAEYLKSLAEAAEKRGFKGLKYLGAKKPKYSYETQTKNVGRGMVIEEKWATDKVLTMRKTNPEKFGYIINTDNENKPTLVILNREDLLPKGKSKVSQAEQEEQWAKERFINDHKKTVLNAAFMTFDMVKTKTLHENLVKLVEDGVWEETVKTVHGKHLNTKALTALSDADLIKLLIAQEYSTTDERFAIMAPAMPELKAKIDETVKLAEAAWPAEKERRAKEEAEAKAKTAKPASKKNKTKPEDDEEPVDVEVDEDQGKD